MEITSSPDNLVSSCTLVPSYVAQISSGIDQIYAETGEMYKEVFNVLNKILSNIVNDPTNIKYKKLNTTSKLWRDVLSQYSACTNFLVFIGFNHTTINNQAVLYIYCIILPALEYSLTCIQKYNQ